MWQTGRLEVWNSILRNLHIVLDEISLGHNACKRKPCAQAAMETCSSQYEHGWHESSELWPRITSCDGVSWAAYEWESQCRVPRGGRRGRTGDEGVKRNGWLLTRRLESRFSPCWVPADYCLVYALGMGCPRADICGLLSNLKKAGATRVGSGRERLLATGEGGWSPLLKAEYGLYGVWSAEGRMR